jgi:sporulation protein YtfJ
MKTAMESIKEMVDVNTVVGDPVETPDGTVVIPVSRVALGFAAGGGEFEINKGSDESVYPFGGGSGAGVSVQPVGFLVISAGQVRLLPVDANVIADRLIDLAPQVLEKIDAYLQRSDREKH